MGAGTGKDEKKAAAGGVVTAGQASARAFVEAELLDEPVHPTMEMERVQVVDPRLSPTLPRIELRKVSGPRATELRTKAEEGAEEGAEGAASLERPATKMQPIRIDPEVLLGLARQAAEKGARGSDAGAALGPSTRSAPAPAREKAGGGRGWLLRGMMPLAAVALLGLVMVAVVSKGARRTEAASVGARGGAAAATEAASLASGASGVVEAPVVGGTAGGEAGALKAGALMEAGAPVAPAPVKPKSSGRRGVDPYDAVVSAPAKMVEPVAPGPAKTVEQAVSAPPIVPAVSAATGTSPAPTVAPSVKPSLLGGDKGVF